MSYLALYRQWRPLQFDDMVEQDHIVKTLRHTIVSEKISHAYLFSGSRGTGKTTTAKIFARAINCVTPLDGNPCNVCSSCMQILNGSSMDVLEIDAASNNSVDNVRNIREEVIYTPSQAKYKVYIIDEVHMLSSGAFNALLKTLEEPPKHAVFILATTEPHKLPATILSRCQRFDFKRISTTGITKRLQTIADKGSVILEDAAAVLISNLADGALRDAISLLDQCMAQGIKTISYETVEAVVGLVSSDILGSIVEHIQQKNVSEVFSVIEQLSVSGKDYRQFVGDLTKYYRNMLLLSISKSRMSMEVSDSVQQKMEQFIKEMTSTDLVRYIKELSLLEANLRWASSPRILTEIGLIRLIEGKFSDSIDVLEKKVEDLEKKLAEGQYPNQSKITPVLKNESQLKATSPQPNVAKTIKNTTMPQKSLEVSSLEAGATLAEWKDIVEDLKKSGRVMLYTCLIGTRAVDLGNSISIVFDTSGSFNKTSVSKPENISVLQSLIEKRLGRTVQVKCTDAEDLIKNESHEDMLRKKAEDIAKRMGVELTVIEE